MKKFFLIAGNLAEIVGVFDSMKSLQEAGRYDDDAVVVTNPNDIYEALTEPQMRRVRADVQARMDGAEDPDTAGTKLFQKDERFSKKLKKMPQAQKLFDDLSAFAAVTDHDPKHVDKPPAEKKPQAPRAPRRNIKQHIRDRFPKVGDALTLEELAAVEAADGSSADYSVVSITTAMSDLRSEKYAGGPLVDVKRHKEADGSIHYVRVG